MARPRKTDVSIPPAAGALVNLRRRCGLTQSELEAASGVPQSEISRIESGQGNPTQSTLDRLGAALGTSLGFAGQSGTNRASPYATGGGGVHFEHQVQARFLIGLLAAPVAPVWDRSTQIEVRFQQRQAGAAFDDVVVVARDAVGEVRNVEVAARHRPRFASSDPKFVSLMQAALRSVRDHPEDYELDRHRLCVVVDSRTRNVDDVRTLTDLARGSTAAGFDATISTLSAPIQKVAESLRKVVALATKQIEPKGPYDDNRDLWRLLAALHVTAIDIESEMGRDRPAAITALANVLVDNDRSKAAGLWERLVNLAAEWDASGVSVDEAVLRRRLSPDYALARSNRFPAAWRQISRLDDQTRNAIHDSLPGGFRVERLALRKDLIDALNGPEPLLVVGEPGVGKSAVVAAAIRDRAGETLIVNVRDLPASMFAFEAQLNVSFRDVIAGARTGSRPLLVFDGGEAILETGDSTLRGVLSALPIGADGWQVCLIGRRDGASKLVDLASQVWSTGVREFSVAGFDDDELAAVREAFPQLTQLLGQPRTRWLIRRPFYLDLLLRREMRNVLDRRRLSESDLMQAFWRETVEIGGRMGDPRGSPAGRDQLMLALAHAHLRGENTAHVVPVEPAAQSGMQADGLLRSVGAGGAVDYSHDVLRDFAVARVLLREGDVGDALVESNAPRWALRATRIACQAILTPTPLADRANEFVSLQNSLARVSRQHGERWEEVAWEAVLTVADPKEALLELWPGLLESEGAGIEQLLLILERRFTTNGSADLPVWRPVIELLLERRADVPSAMLSRLDEALNEVLTSAAQLRFQRVGSSVTEDSISPESVSSTKEYLLGRLQPHRGNELILKSLALLDSAIAPDVAAAFRDTAEHRPDELRAIVEDALCSRAVVSRDPALLLTLAESYYIIKQKPHRSQWPSPHDEGIRDHRHSHIGFPFANWWFGPFYLLLQVRPLETIAFINRMLDHAAQRRVEILASLSGGGSAEQGVRLSVDDLGERLFVGDDHVYRWYRGTAVGPYPCVSALLAVERFVEEFLAEHMPIGAIGRWLLRDSHNLASLGLWVGVLVRRLEEVATELDPILASSAIWELEAARIVGDQAGFRAQQPAEMHNEERRSWYLGQVAAWLVLHADRERQDALRTLGESLVAADPTSPVLRNWASQLDAASYRLERVGENILIKQRPPEEVAEQLERDADTRNDLMRIQQVAFNYGGERGRLISIESEKLRDDINFAQQIVERQLQAFGDLSLDAVAAVAAAGIRANSDGNVTLQVAQLEWCIGTILELAARVPTRRSGLGVVEEERWDMGWDRSVAQAVPLIAAETPDRPGVAQALQAIGETPYEETQHVFAEALAPLWSAGCNARSETPCIHEVAFGAIKAMLARLRLGPWDNALQRRPQLQFAEPLIKSIRESNGRDVSFMAMGGAASALDVCARSSACVAHEAAELLQALFDLHAKGWIAWAGREEYVDARQANPVHLIAAGLVLDGDQALLDRLIQLYQPERALLAAWLDALVDAAVGESRQHRLVAMWPGVMDRLMPELSIDRSSRRYYETEAIIESLIPAPLTEFEVHLWPSPELLDSRIRTLIQSLGDRVALANKLVRYLSARPLEVQLTYGIEWFEILINGFERNLAQRTRIGRWLRKIRDQQGGRWDPMIRGKWQRIVDGLAAADDSACIRLQQEEE